MMDQPQPHTCTPSVRFSGMSFSYGDSVIIDNADVSICTKDFVSVIGPNGSGKTTLLKLILGLLEPTSGSLEVLGTTPVLARPRVGYVAQQTHFDPSFPVNVLEVALMGRLTTAPLLGPWRKKDRDRALQALEEVSLADKAQRPFDALSGGQRQRVLIARALASDPELLILDEAMAHLDMKIEMELFNLLERLNERMTIILVSHDLAVVSQCVKSVLCVREGVHLHPTSELTGDLVARMYGGSMRMVRHDHRCSEGGHTICGRS